MDKKQTALIFIEARRRGHHVPNGFASRQNKKYGVYFLNWARGGTGIHVRFRSVFRKDYGFESHRAHPSLYKHMKTKLFFTTSKINTYLKKEKPSSLVIVTSRNIFKTNIWIFDLIQKSGIRQKVIFVKDGENAKTFDELQSVLYEFSKFNVDRSSIVIGIGGGTVGDLVGFAASIYLRGIKLVNIPTTLLAQVDSAHGGKNGINFKGYKNQIGTVYLPEAIFVDSKFLKTLNRELIIDGLGEIIKYGFIKDKSILNLLDADLKHIDLIIKKSIACKNYFTDKDLHEKNVRAALNFGHTFGHSIELKYKVSHGKAVIIGMLKELDFMKKFALKATLEEILRKLHIDIDERKYAINKGSILHDKKLKGDMIDFPIIESLGKVQIKKINIKSIQ